uniref:Reverse transcriptase domain-containing protein n=1 Tax=Hordeum vulgare subsp. vulgare TaxID=112509 RepID=A0A8I6WU71_HORVV
MPSRKAPGPDGFTAEFLRSCWQIIKHDLRCVFDQIYVLHGRGFSCLNQALITLLHKRAEATSMGDYRPISLIHIVAKVLAKLLSIRLAPRLNNLVSNVQNAFISGRSLHDNFILVRQSTRLLHQLGAPRVLLKLDLARAFDSVSWPFLFEVLRCHGFGNRFLGWIALLLSSASTKVLLNGNPGPAIWHRRGLRQGDPVSPQLFVLAVDTLGGLFHHAVELRVMQQLHPRRAIPTISLYADDVILLCHPSPNDIATVKEILQLFGRASGLHVNFQKSAAALIRCDTEDAAHVVAHLGCPIVDFPLTYLGIPLTLRRPTAAQLQPVVDKVAGKLPSWKAWLMNKAGRLAFAKAILSAIPIHQLLVLAPPKKTIKLLEKIEQGFLWAGRADAHGGNCHVNWRLVCQPIQFGGLGVHDLERTDLALRMRWQWLSRVDADIHGMIGIPEIGEYLRLWHMIAETVLTDARDSIRWKWTANGEYSAKSAYLATFHGSARCQAWKLTWKCWAPPRVRFFHSFANLDRCWTADRLARRNLPHPQRCPLCDQAPETIHHLLLEWPFTREVWHEILSWLRLSCLLPNNDATLHDWWCSARHDTPRPMHKGLASVALLVPWMIWKHRNGCVFERATPSVTSLAATIKEEAGLWARAGALGLRAILRQTWDVH